MTEPPTTELAVPRWTRRFVYGFLAVLLICGVASIEAWPFSGFKLFSAIRDGQRTSTEIVWVDPDDREATVRLKDLPVGYRNTTTLIGEFDGMTDHERDEVCDAWAAPHLERGDPVESIRVYRRDTPLGSDDPPTRELLWECAER